MDKKQNAERRKKLQKKKRLQRIYAFVVLLSGIVIIVLSVLLLFHIQKIKVHGNEYSTDQEVVDSVKNDRFSTNSLYLTGKYALGKGTILPCFERLEVSMKNPWTIKIDGKEKPIVACMKDGENYIYFDETGLVVDQSSVKRMVPVVKGLALNFDGEYKELQCADTELFTQVLDACRELQNYNLSVDKINCKNDRIYLRIDNIKVNLGENITAQKIAQIPPIVEKLDGQKGTLHLENYADGQETITFEKAKKSE